MVGAYGIRPSNLLVITGILKGARFHWCQLNVDLAVETAATQTKPAYAGFKTPVFSLVRAGGLGFYSSEFHSPELKLTPMARFAPLHTRFT